MFHVDRKTLHTNLVITAVRVVDETLQLLRLQAEWLAIALLVVGL